MTRLLAPMMACLTALAAVSPAWAQSDDPHGILYELAMIEADHDVCGFPLSDEQRDVIAQRRDALVTRGDIAEADVAAVRDQVTAAVERQRGTALCRADGAEARLYKRRLTSQGLL